MSEEIDWTKEEAAFFNAVYNAIKAAGKKKFLHPETDMADKEFETVCWNAAVVAAAVYGGNDLEVEEASA